MFAPKSVLSTVLVALACGFPVTPYGASAAAVDVSPTSTRPACAKAGDVADGREVWMMSTRSCRGGEGPRCYRYERGRWLVASLDEFLAGDDSEVPTVVFVHGARCDMPLSLAVGWECLAQIAPRDRRKRFRYVIWSWPAESQSKRPIDGFRQQASTADREGPKLARILARINHDVPVCLVSHSFGGRVVSGALHVLAGGRIDGVGLEDSPLPQGRTFDAVYMAAAFCTPRLAPGQRFGRALQRVDRLLVIYNSRDCILTRYRVLDPCCRCGPLGVTGLPRWRSLAELDLTIHQINVAPWIRKGHTWSAYADACIVSRFVRSFVRP